MKILHILRKEPSETVKKIIELQKNGNDVRVVELYKDRVNYSELLNLIFECDRVISW